MESGRLRQIGPYRLVRKLGHGGMSSVFLAEDDKGEQVALKLLNLSLEDEPEFRKRFQREAELTQRLDHPNIVKTFHWHDDPDVGVYLVMEFVPGGNLRQRLESAAGSSTAGSQPWPLAEVVSCFKPVAAAIDYAHGQGVVHRDLKPENLLFTSDGQLKIADFGVARVESGSRLTRTGVLPGTPEYMAPEQFSDQPAGPPADVYSLATIIYELLTGNTPFRSDNLAQVLQRQAFDIPQLPSQRCPGVPHQLDRLLLKALEKKPAHRFASAGELLQALADAPTRSSGSHTRAPSGSSSVSDLPTRQVNWRNSPAERKGTPPWFWVWLIWTAAALAWCARLIPTPAAPYWLTHPVGWQSAPVGRQLCASVVWNGFEVALVGPDQQQKALPRARFAAGQLRQWLLQRPNLELAGAKESDGYLISAGGEEWLRVDHQMAANLKATQEQVGEYWLALLKDVQALEAGKAPGYVRELERKRPLRLDGTPPRYLLLERLYEHALILDRQGPLEAAALVTSLNSLGSQDSKRLRESARSVPRPLP